MSDAPGLIAYTQRLRRVTIHADPTADNAHATAIRAAADDLETLRLIDFTSLTGWVTTNPEGVYTLALAVGLSQEKLRNLLRAEFGTASWARIARDEPGRLVSWMDDEFALIPALQAQVGRSYSFGEVLAARGASRQTASSAGVAGRLVEDRVEAIVNDLGLPYRMRGRFVGVNGRTAPADIAIPDFTDCVIAVGCKGFDSTGSKLTAAVSEITEMVDVHRPHQYLMAVVDGIGWLGRMRDLRRMWDHYEQRRIEGLYTLSDLDQFHSDLEAAAQRARLLP
ncbi:MAG: hypothetical protein ACRCSN_11385 [Dermatophilaceae bacterium]